MPVATKNGRCQLSGQVIIVGEQVMLTRFGWIKKEYTTKSGLRKLMNYVCDTCLIELGDDWTVRGEIEHAKKCLLRSLNYPPRTYAQCTYMYEIFIERIRETANKHNLQGNLPFVHYPKIEEPPF